MDVVVEVGGWEHECCGEAVERNQLVDFRCSRSTTPDGQVHVVEGHHHDLDVPDVERVRGRVTDLHVVTDRGPRPVRRVPSGAALCGSDPEDDGHLEVPWDGAVIRSTSHDFLVTVRTSGWS